MKPDLEAIRKRLEAVTPGPWKWDRCLGGTWALEDSQGVPLLYEYGPTGLQVETPIADFIAHAPGDIAALLERVEELEAVMTKGQKWRRSMMTESERTVEALKCPGDSSDLEYEQAQVHRMTCESSLMQALAALEEAP